MRKLKHLPILFRVFLGITNSPNGKTLLFILEKKVLMKEDMNN